MANDRNRVLSRDVPGLDEAARQALATPDLADLSELATLLATIRSYLGYGPDSSRMGRRKDAVTMLKPGRPLLASPPLPLVILATRGLRG